MSSDQPRAEYAIRADSKSVSAQMAEHGVPGLLSAGEHAAHTRKRRGEASHRTRVDAGTPQGQKMRVDGEHSHGERDARLRLDAMALARARAQEVRVALCMATRMVDEAGVERAQASSNSEHGARHPACPVTGERLEPRLCICPIAHPQLTAARWRRVGGLTDSSRRNREPGPAVP
jgi:hypothetical protein